MLALMAAEPCTGQQGIGARTHRARHQVDREASVEVETVRRHDWYVASSRCDFSLPFFNRDCFGAHVKCLHLRVIG